MSQLRSDELHRQEDALAKAEAEVAAREARLATREIELEARLGGERERLLAVEEKLRALAQAGSAEADHFVQTGLPELPPAPGYGDRLKAITARRDAIQARTVSVQSREKAVAVLDAGLSRSDGAVAAAEAEGNRIEASFAAQRRKQAEERRAAQQPAPAPPAPPRAPPPPPAVAAATPVGRMEAPPRSPPPPPKLAPPNTVAARPGANKEAAKQRQRTRLDCEVSFESEHNFFEGFARNLSEGGLFVAAWDYLPVGSEIEVAFSLPGGPRIEARAVVRWVRELNDATPDVWPGMGLQFLNLPPGAEGAIQKFMAEREPLFFPD